MKIGIVSYWFNRGQAVVSRHLRSILDSQGHETHILARLTRKSFFKPFFVDKDDVWAQDRVTHGSAYNIQLDEYLEWIERTGIEVIFFDQNLQLDEIKAIRSKGVLTVGRFVWESFGPDDVKGALDAFDCIYSLTKCEQERYKQFDIESPYIKWGCHPELLRVKKTVNNDNLVRFFYPGGYLSKRKPTDEAIKAFCQVQDPRARLTVKAQHGVRGNELADRCKELDSRINVIVGDLPTSEYLELFASSDVSLAPSRWEGLGLHLYEAVSFGIPTITNNAPPMNEVVTDGKTGVLFDSTLGGYRRPGVPILEPCIQSMANAIESLCDDEFRHKLHTGVLEQQKSLSWTNTSCGYKDLLKKLMLNKEVKQ
jgi:1,2-diacylglycerol 3-alpha-glucosyltransferase